MRFTTVAAVVVCAVNASWKSGFLKKRPAEPGVVDRSRKLKLQNHVGHRVAVTGRVQDGGIDAQSMRHLAASCGH